MVYRTMMRWEFDDGGRAAAGYKGFAGDCVVRAIAIAAELPYLEVYKHIDAMAKSERVTKRAPKQGSAREGVYRKTYDRFIIHELGWTWFPTMGIGTGCRVHMRESELPDGRLIVRLSKHVTCVIDGVIHDIYDPSRNGFRCVYGYWKRV